jgi:hypothetical protein
MYIARRMGRGAARALQVAGLMREFASRAEFDAAGCLVTFIGLDLLAVLAGTNEKTIRRAIADLQNAGVLKIEHRFDDSNRYYLTTPPEAEDHLQHCDVVREQRRRARQKRRSQVSTGGGQMGVGTAPKCPTNSDSNSDYNSIPKGTDFGKSVLSEDPFSDFRNGKEKRLSEEVRGGEAELYRIARESFGGESGASVVARAIRGGGMSSPDVWRVMTEEIDAGNTGDAQSLAYALSPSWAEW